MNGWDWNAIYLTCFGVGLALSAAAFFGAGHLRFGHFHMHAPRGHAHHGGFGAFINGFTLMAFLCWFGGTGYLMHQAHIFSVALVLFFAAVSGMAGAALIGWFLTRVLMPGERTLEDADTEMCGVIGHLSTNVPAGGFGEMLYSQNGSRRCSTVRSEDGEALERGMEVVVMRYKRGVAYVRRWDEFEHGLLQEAVSKE